MYRILDKLARLPDAIDPSVKFGVNCVIGNNVNVEEDVILGDNVFIGHGATIRPRTTIGDNSDIRANAFVASDVEIGKHVVIMQFSNIAGKSRLRDYIFIGPHTVITNSNELVSSFRKKGEIKRVHVYDGVRIASNCTILPGVKIEENCIIGAASLVTQDILTCQVWYGNPAKFIRYIKPEEDYKTLIGL